MALLMFRVFQRIWKDLQMKPDDQNLRELAKFAKFILRKERILSVDAKFFLCLIFFLLNSASRYKY